MCMRCSRRGWVPCFPRSSPTASLGFETWARPCPWRTSIVCAKNRKRFPAGTRIVAAGRILDGRPKPLRPNFLAITTPEEARDTVRRLKIGGADLIKVYSELSRDSFLAIGDEAKKQNIPFSGHVPFSVSALEASDAGQKSMEHLWGIYFSCSSREEELRSEMLKGGVNLSGSERIRLEMDEAAASYDERKAANVFAHLAKNGTWMVPTFSAVVPDTEIFDVRVTTDPRLNISLRLFRSSGPRQPRQARQSRANPSIESFKLWALCTERVSLCWRGPIQVGPTVYLCWILFARRTCTARESRFDADRIATNSDNQPGTLLRNGKRLGTIEKGKSRISCCLRPIHFLIFVTPRKFWRYSWRGRNLIPAPRSARC